MGTIKSTLKRKDFYFGVITIGVFGFLGILIGLGLITLQVFYFGVVTFGFLLTFLVTALYGFLAPWWKSETGKAFFTLLLALTLLLLNSTVRVFFRDGWSPWIGVSLFALYCVAMTYIGWHVWQAQVRTYLSNKKKSVA